MIDGAAVNPNGIKTVLANSLSTFFIEGKPVFSNGNKSLLKNPADPPSLCNWVFDDFILANEVLAKVFLTLITFVSVMIIYVEN